MPSKPQIEPPPAATLSMARAGATRWASPTRCSKRYSKSPSQRATSVLVPPMSKAITLPKPDRRPARAAPDHAAGGAGEEAVLGAEGAGPHQPAGAGHHVERALRRSAPETPER